MKTRKRRAPTKKQWGILRGIIGNGWGNGDYGRAFGEFSQCVKALRALDGWLEDKYNCKYSVPLDT